MVLRLATLAASAAPLIVTATEPGHGRFVSLARELSGRFEVVPLPPAGHEATIEILRALRPRLDEFHHVAITDDALAAAVEFGARDPGGRGRALPGAAVDLLDAAAARSAAARPGDQETAAILAAEQVRAQYESDAG
jgi:ATP-dependent Clp protease ATP-binding subunit ClpC